MATGTENPVGELARAVHDAVMESLGGQIPDIARAVKEALLRELPALVRAEVERSVLPHAREMARAHDDFLKSLPALLKSLPASRVDVHVPEKAIAVELSQAEQHFHVPEKAIRVEVAAPPPAQVHISDKAFSFSIDTPAPVFSPRIEVAPAEARVELVAAPPAVNVHVPRQAAPVVNVEAPKRRTRVEKSILYSAQTGRPEKVIEETTEG